MNLSIIYIVLSSAVVAALITSGIQVIVHFLERKQERYEVLYGPLRYHLLMMKIITDNNTEIRKEINDEIKNIEVRIKSMQTHISPLTQKWLEHRDIIRTLIQTNPGFVKKCDFNLISEFLDACLKREIIQEGQNELSTDERISKISDVVQKLQNRLL